MTSTTSLAEELRLYGFESVKETALKLVLSFISTNDIDVEDVVSDLVAFSSNRNEPELTDQLITEFKKEFFHKTKPQKNNERNGPTPPRHELSVKSDQDLNIMAAYGASPVTPVQTSKRQQSTPDSPNHKRRSNTAGTPKPVNAKSPLFTTPNRKSTRESVTPSSKKYTKRSNKCEVVFSYGATNLVASWQGEREELAICSNLSKRTEEFRYMFQKLQDRAYVLDRRIESLSESIQQAHLSDIEEFTSVSEKTNTEVFARGQICCDCEGKLNTESVLLQGCMDVSGGRAVPVSIKDLPKYSLFPGQFIRSNLNMVDEEESELSDRCAQYPMVVLKGQSDDGGRLNATECLLPEALPTPIIKSCQGLSLIVACGPFTPDNTSDYAPLNDLLEQAMKSPPDVLILMGPFIDTDNQVLQHSVESYDAIFTDTIDSILSKTVAISPSMQLVIVSSHKDLHHEPIYPTPPYRLDIQPPLEQKVHFVMNPSTLDIDGVRIGLTATDVLFQMAANEISWDAPTKDRMLRLSEHLVSQRSYFPVYPPNSDINLDLELNEKHSCMTASPHLLLVSSNFNQFIKTGNETVFANPGRLCKGEGGGTYMKMLINPLTNISTIADSFIAEIVRI